MHFISPDISIYAALFGLSLLVTSLGFRKLVYFVSIGYTFAILTMSVFTLFVFRQNLSGLSVLHIVGLMVWSLRLGVFLIRRETASSYQNERERVETRYNPGSFIYRALIWLATSSLYVLMFLPAFLNAAGAAQGISTPAQIWQTLGLIVMLAGLVLETLADRQKTAFKNQNPGQFCNTGLYSWVRCPNYLGEILFWTGSWVMGVPFFSTALGWIAGLAGLVCLILIMMGSTKRLEAAQTERYAHLESYQSYIRSVPVLFPFLPIYSLKNVRVVLE
jgi:steroid 5-alpha reductase family enzyme